MLALDRTETGYISKRKGEASLRLELNKTQSYRAGNLCSLYSEGFGETHPMGTVVYIPLYVTHGKTSVGYEGGEPGVA